MPEPDESLHRMEARVTALGLVIDNLLSALVTKSLLNREHIASILHETEAVLQQSSQPEASLAGLRTLQETMPNLWRAAAARQNPSGGWRKA